MRDGRVVIVYKLANGRYSRPITLSKSDAIDVACKFAKESIGDRDRKINLAAANFIYVSLQKLGWLPDGEDSICVDDDSTVAELDSSALSAAGPTRKYFPFLAATQEPSLNEDLIGDIAFVLSSVDPAKRIDPAMIRQSMNLAMLTRKPEYRIRVGGTLIDDHWYVLSHLHSLQPAEFRAHWALKKSHMTDHDATDLARISRKLHEFELDATGSVLKDPRNHDLLIGFYEQSVEILIRQYLVARKKLDELHKPTSGEKGNTPGRRQWLKSFGRGKQPESQCIALTDSERDIAARYLTAGVKLGRILRCELIQRVHRQSKTA